MEKYNKEFIGATFSVLRPANNLSIVHVVGFEEKGENFLGDSYYGLVTYILKDGTATETRRWSSSVEVFNKLTKVRIR